MKFTKKQHHILITIWIILAVLLPGNSFGITPLEEKKMSEKFLKEVSQHFKFIDDQMIIKYVNKVGQRILKTLPAQPYKFRFYVIKEGSYNAFAGPGGVIFINSGLIEAMDTENELAGILAHEILHVACRHLSDRIEKSKKIGIASLAGLVGAIALGAAGAGAAANAAIVGSIAAGQSMMLAYSRQDEIQADQSSLEYLAKAGYNAKGLLIILEKIRNKQWFGSDQIPTYLMTHPAVEDRISYISNWIESNSEMRKNKSKGDNPYFSHVKTRLMALYGDVNTLFPRFQVRVNENADDSIASYGYGLLLERRGNYKKAAIYLKKSLEKNAFDPDLLVDLGRVLFLNNNYSQALTTLEGALSISPFHQGALFFLGRSHMNSGNFHEAATVFESLINKHKGHKNVDYFIGNVYSRLGKPSKAYHHLGIHYAKKGAFEKAILQLKKALKLSKDADQKSKIEKDLKKVKGKLVKRRVKKKDKGS